MNKARMKPISKKDVQIICSEAKPYFAIDLERYGKANGRFDCGSLFPSLMQRLVGRRFNWWKNFHLHIWITKGVRGNYRYAFYLSHSDGFMFSEDTPNGNEPTDWEWRKVLVEKLPIIRGEVIQFN